MYNLPGGLCGFIALFFCSDLRYTGHGAPAPHSPAGSPAEKKGGSDLYDAIDFILRYGRHPHQRGRDFPGKPGRPAGPDGGRRGFFHRHRPARPYLGGLPLTLPAILYNGAAVYDYKTESFLYKACLKADTVARLVETALNRYPEVCVQAFTGGRTRMLNPNGLPDPYVTREKQPTRPSTLAEALADGCFKLLFYGDSARLHDLERVFLVEAPGSFVSTYSASFYLEILPYRATKGDALAWLAAYLNKPREAFAAIGDYDNDVTMIRFAGLGAAPSDAQPCAREAADVVVASHRDHAVADLVRRYLLPRT